MKKIAVSKKEKKKLSKTRFFILVLGLLVIVVFVFLFLNNQSSPIRLIKPVVDSPKTEMRNLPPEIKNIEHFATTSATFRVPIIMYHYVEYVQDKRDKFRQLLDVNPDVFESQVETLKNAGYTFMTAKQLGEVFDGKMQMPQNPVLLTFDDGHWDFDTVVLPILKKYNIKATAYIITGFIGGSDFMSAQQLQDVVNSGLVDVGAHTVHHFSLKGLPLTTDLNEVDQSKAWLEQNYHINVTSFAYPNGSFDLQAAQVVKDDGFSTAVSTIPGIEQNNANRFYLYRLRPGYRTGPELLDWIQQSSFTAY